VSPAPANLGFVTLQEQYALLDGSDTPVAGVHFKAVLSGLFSDAGADLTLVGTTFYGVSKSDGILKQADASYNLLSGPGGLDILLPVSNDPDVPYVLTYDVTETFPNGLFVEYFLTLDSSLGGLTKNLRQLRDVAPSQPLINPQTGLVSVGQMNEAIAAAISGLGSQVSLLDGSSKVKSSFLQTEAATLTIPGVLTSNQQSVPLSHGYQRTVSKIAFEVDEPSLAGDIVAVVTWENRSTGVRSTATTTLTQKTELYELNAAGDGGSPLPWVINPADLVYVTVSSTGSTYGGRNLRVTLIGPDAGWPNPAAAPPNLASASITSGILTVTPGAGTTPNIFVTVGTGGAEAPLNSAANTPSVFASGASVDVSSAAGQPVNVYPANRDKVGATPITIGANVYFYQPAGSSVDTSKVAVSSTNGSVTCTGGYLVEASGNATNFGAADRTYVRLQSAVSTDLSLTNINMTIAHVFTTTGQKDFYYRGSAVDDNYSSSGTSYQVTVQPSAGTWAFKKHVGGVTTTIASGSLPTITLGVEYTIRIQVSGTSHSAKIWQSSSGEGTATVFYAGTTDSAVAGPGKIVIVANGPGTGGAVRTYKDGAIAIS
jgi:hypothetical protein